MSTAAIVVIVLLSINFLRMIRDTARGWTQPTPLYSVPFCTMMAAALYIGGAFSTGTWGGYFLVVWLAFGFVGGILPLRKQEVDFTVFVASLLPIALQVYAIVSTGFFLPA